jgi:hypothetical protein
VIPEVDIAAKVGQDFPLCEQQYQTQCSAALGTRALSAWSGVHSALSAQQVHSILCTCMHSV